MKNKKFIGYVLGMSLIMGQTFSALASNDIKYISKNEVTVNDESIINATDGEDIPDVLREELDIEDEYIKRLKGEEEDLNTIICLNKEGNRVMYKFQKEVKFVDDDGEIKDKSISFEKSLGDEYAVENGENDVKLYLKDSIQEGIELSFGDDEICMSVENTEEIKDVELKDNTAVYENVFGNGTSVKYKPLLDGIKEEIILDYYTGQTEFEFIINTGEYILGESDDNCLYIKTKDTDETVGIIDSVYMIDAKGVTDFNNYYKYENIGEGVYKVIACVNKEFLESRETQYPVIIDPTITITKDSSTYGIYDATVNSHTGSDGKSGSLFVGNRGGQYGISRTVMCIPALFSKYNVSVVLNASIYLRDLMCGKECLNVGCYALTNIVSNWNETNASWSYLNIGGNCYTVEGATVKGISYANGLKESESHMYKFDITNIVSNWRMGKNGTPDKGIIFKGQDEKISIYKTFGSNNRASYNPVFKMEYVGYAGGYNYYSFKSLVEESAKTEMLENPTRPNCLGLALHQKKIINATTIGVLEVEKYYVVKVAKNIENYVNSGKCSEIKKAEYMGVGLKSSYTVASNQYLIGVRVKTDRTKPANWDFHVIAQMNNGQWINKHGEGPIQKLGYINPDITIQPCWKDAMCNDYYNSETVYIRLTIK